MLSGRNKHDNIQVVIKMENIIGSRIKESRRRAGYPTQDALATALRTHYGFKTDRPMVSKWESGYQVPEMYTIKCIAELCNVSTDYLCGKENAYSTEKTHEAEPGETHLISLYHELNSEGRELLVDYADTLVASEKYIKSSTSGLGKAQV